MKTFKPAQGKTRQSHELKRLRQQAAEQELRKQLRALQQREKQGVGKVGTKDD